METNYTIMSIEEDRDETFDRLPHLSMTEILRTRNKKNLQYDKSTYEKSRPNIIQHERPKAFSLSSVTRLVCQLLSLLSNIVLEE